MKSKIMNPHKISAHSDNFYFLKPMLLFELNSISNTNRDVLLLATILVIWGSVLNNEQFSSGVQNLTRVLFIDLSLYGCLCFIFSWDFPLFFDYEKHHIKICSAGDKTFIFVLLCTLSFVSFFNGLSPLFWKVWFMCAPSVSASDSAYYGTYITFLSSLSPKQYILFMYIVLTYFFVE